MLIVEVNLTLFHTNCTPCLTSRQLRLFWSTATSPAYMKSTKCFNSLKLIWLNTIVGWSDGFWDKISSKYLLSKQCKKKFFFRLFRSNSSSVDDLQNSYNTCWQIIWLNKTVPRLDKQFNSFDLTFSKYSIRAKKRIDDNFQILILKR